MVTLVFSNHSYFIFSVDFASEVCYNKDIESKTNKCESIKIKMIKEKIKMYTAEDFYEAYSYLYKTTKEEAIEVYENCSEEFAYETICRYRYPDKYPFQRSTEYEDY